VRGHGFAPQSYLRSRLLCNYRGDQRVGSTESLGYNSLAKKPVEEDYGLASDRGCLRLRAAITGKVTRKIVATMGV